MTSGLVLVAASPLWLGFPPRRVPTLVYGWSLAAVVTLGRLAARRWQVWRALTEAGRSLPSR